MKINDHILYNSKIYLLGLLLLLITQNIYASNDWTTDKMSDLGKRFSECIKVPNNINYDSGSTNINIESKGWVSTGKYVQKDKALKINWTANINARPSKYIVLYRIDPRFSSPITLIAKYNYVTNKYIVKDFPFFTSNIQDKDIDSLSFYKIKEYLEFLNSTQDILVNKDDIIEIKMIGESGFWSNIDTNNLNGLFRDRMFGVPASFSPTALYTSSGIGGDSGGIIYSSAKQICSSLDPNNTIICSIINGQTLYNSQRYGGIVGIPFSDAILKKINKDIPECNNFSVDPNANPLCLYTNGVGMKISAGSTIKDSDVAFTPSNISQKLFFYHKAESNSKLKFTTDFSLQNMFPNLKKTNMSEWIGFLNPNDLLQYLSNSDSMLNVHAGSYSMAIEIGNGKANNDNYNNLKVEYFIQDDTSILPTNNSIAQNNVDTNTSVTADKTGYLWVRVINNNDQLEGNVNIEYLNYTGSTWFSNIVYLGIVKPVNDQFQSFTKQFYIKFSRNASIINLIQGCLTLYISIYGIMFLIGATRVTAEDLFYRIFKIFLVTMVISENSWEFFNNYLFELFTKGTDELFRSITGTSSTTQNIFGFIDPILDKYTNPQLWGLLFIQLFQIHNGLTIVAIMSIYSLIIYFRAILEVIISYVISFLIISVIIGLAPLFIIFILFEKTRNLFDNWLSTLFNYMVQPSILLIFFLFIDQIISDQLLKIVVKSCWGTLVPIAINLNLDHIGFSGIDFSFSIPFFPGIPFFIPQVEDIKDIQNLGSSNFLVIFTSTLLFYCYCLIAKGLVDYVSTISSQLMNVAPATSDSKNAPSNPVENMMHDMKKASAPVTSAATRPFKLFKDKVIDQNYQSKGRSSNEEPELYGNKLMESRNDAPTTDSKTIDGK